jgi:hypothetical protein
MMKQVKLWLAAISWLFINCYSSIALAAFNETKLMPDDPAEFDQFGVSVAVDGSTAIVGAFHNGDAGMASGSAYLFDATSGDMTRKLGAEDAAAGDEFGFSVAINNNIALVGAAGNDDNGNSSGSAYLFDATTGAQLTKLTAFDAAPNDRFGWSVAIHDNRALVGAYADDSVGSAYLYDVTTHQHIAKLRATDAALSDVFGYSVAISGSRALVGALGDDDGGSFSGSAYLFDSTTGQQLAKLTASDAAAGDRFGRSVSISGNYALIGAHENDDKGAAYLFNAVTGQEIAKLTASDGAVGDQFGWSVAIQGNLAIVGAYSDDDAGANSGSAYLFNVATGQEISKLTASDGMAFDQLGYSVAISSDFALTGAIGSNNLSGSAYLFEIPEPTTAMISLVISCLGLSSRHSAQLLVTRIRLRG